MKKIAFRKTVLCISSLLLAALLITTAVASQNLRSIVLTAWTNLPSSKNQCDTYDYFPNGGMRNFYCHLKSFMTFKELQKKLGLNIFLSGPHTNELNLKSKTSFGHYNPEFVKRLPDLLIPGRESPNLRRQLQPVYNKYIKDLARIFYVSYRKIQSNPEFLNSEIERYRKTMKKGTHYDYEGFFYFMNTGYIKRSNNPDSLFNDGFDGGWDGNVTKTCVAFWIRRAIDGTDKYFFNGLEILLQTYDRKFLKKYKG